MESIDQSKQEVTKLQVQQLINIQLIFVEFKLIVKSAASKLPV